MKLCFPAVLTLLLLGCASNQPKIDASRLAEVEKGKTTIAEVISRFGRPTVLSKNMDDTQTAAYSQAEGRSDASAYFPLMAAIVSNTDASVASVIFDFDANGVLTRFRTTQGPEPTAQAASIPQDASASQAAPAGQSPQASRDSSSSKPGTNAAKPAQTESSPTRAEAKSAPGDSSPWTIQLYPSGYRENR